MEVYHSYTTWYALGFLIRDIAPYAMSNFTSTPITVVANNWWPVHYSYTLVKSATDAIYRFSPVNFYMSGATAQAMRQIAVGIAKTA